ncbi:MAG: hypothetical protein FWG40_00840 [Peptococcaceae bacterium]|nr:hypothetical protein [Peptococcaceae bacterium]
MEKLEAMDMIRAAERVMDICADNRCDGCPFNVMDECFFNYTQDIPMDWSSYLLAKRSEVGANE